MSADGTRGSYLPESIGLVERVCLRGRKYRIEVRTNPGTVTLITVPYLPKTLRRGRKVRISGRVVRRGINRGTRFVVLGRGNLALQPKEDG